MALIFHWYAMKVLTGILIVFKISLLELSWLFHDHVSSCIGLVSVFSQSCLGLIKSHFGLVLLTVETPMLNFNSTDKDTP